MYGTRHQITPPTWRSLNVIARYQPLSAKELAEKTSADPSIVARAIEVLLGRGLITREVDAEDRRKIRLWLTRKGKVICDDVNEFAERVEHVLIETLTENERAVLLKCLDKVDAQISDSLLQTNWEDMVDD